MSGWIPAPGAFRLAVVLMLAAITGALLGTAINVVDIDQHLKAQEQRQFMDCYVSPTGDEFICKQVTATEPYQRP